MGVKLELGPNIINYPIHLMSHSNLMNDECRLLVTFITS